MLNLVWNPAARPDLRNILAYIAERNQSAAERLGQLMEGAAERLVSHLFSHRAGRAEGTREAVVHPNDILIYEVGLDQVEIMAVIHSRREYPSSD